MLCCLQGNNVGYILKLKLHFVPSHVRYLTSYIIIVHTLHIIMSMVGLGCVMLVTGGGTLCEVKYRGGEGGGKHGELQRRLYSHHRRHNIHGERTVHLCLVGMPSSLQSASHQALHSPPAR